MTPNGGGQMRQPSFRNGSYVLFHYFCKIFCKIFFANVSEELLEKSIHLSIYKYKNPAFSVRYLKKSELLDRLRLFMDQLVHYIHGKVCSLSSV